MALKDYAEWRRQVRALLSELATQGLVRPLAVNEVRAPVSPVPPLPTELRPLYAVSNGVCLPDVHVGYFLDTAHRVETAALRGEPTRIEGAAPMAVHVFGTDGGGGRFAVRLDDCSIYYLPSSGAVRDGVFHEDAASSAERIADTMLDFLWRIKDDINAFVRGKDDHKYIAR